MSSHNHKILNILIASPEYVPRIVADLKALFDPILISSPMLSITNGFTTIAVASCGSKVHWPDDADHIQAIDTFMANVEKYKFEDGTTVVWAAVVEMNDALNTISLGATCFSDS